MLKVECESCKAPYQVDERRVPPTGLKMRCPKCGHTFLVTDPSKGGPAGADGMALPAAPNPKKATMVGLAPKPGAPFPAPATRPPEPPPPAAAAPAPPAADLAGLDFDIALPVVKPGPATPRRPGAAAAPAAAAAVPAPAAPPPAFGALDDLDLPALAGDVGLPASAARGGKPGLKPPPAIAKVAPPAAAAKAAPAVPSFDFEVDLPAVPGPGAPAAKAPPPAGGGGGGFGEIDLPAPRAGGPELPALKAPKAPPAARPAPAAKPAPAPFGDLPLAKSGTADLPAARGGPPPGPRPPAPKTGGAGAGAAAGFGEIDLPIVQNDLPTAGGGSNLPSPLGHGANLPSPVAGGAHLPSPVGNAAYLPSPVGANAHLPSPVGAGAHLPSPVGVGAHLPSPMGAGAHLPSPMGAGAHLPSPMGANAHLPSPMGANAHLPTAMGAGAHLPTAMGAGAHLPTAMGADAHMPSPLTDERLLPEKQGGGGMAFGELDLPLVGDGGGASDAPRGFGEVDLPIDSALSAPPMDAGAGAGGMGFGEVDLGGSVGPSSTPLGPPPATSAGSFQEASLEPAAPAIKERGRPAPEAPSRPSKLPKILGGAIVVIVLGGAALQLTPLGAFGNLWLGDKIHATEYIAIASVRGDEARKKLALDTFASAQSAADDIFEARRKAPRSRPMGAYAALIEYEKQVRFGADPARAARVSTLLTEIPPNVEVTYLAAAQAAQTAQGGDWAKAKQAVDAAMTREPKDGVQLDLTILKGEIALAQKDAPGALAAFTSANAIAPSARTAFGMARAYMLTKNLTKAREAVATALKASPAHPGALTLRSQLIWEMQRDDVAAVKDLNALLDEKSRKTLGTGELAAALTAKGWIMLARDRAGEARAAFDEAVKNDSRNVSALVGQGEVLYADGRHAEAQTRFDDALTRDPSNVAAIIGSAKSKIALEHLSDAKPQLTAARQKAPRDMSLALWLAKVEALLNNPKGAEDLYAIAIDLADPQNPESVQAYAQFALFLASQGRKVDAEAKIEAARAKLPDTPARSRAFGDVAVAQGEFARALEQYDAALKANPNDLGTRYRLGDTYRKLHKLDLAAKALDEVAAIDKEYPGIALARGLLFEESGDVQKALDQFNSALQKSPSDPDLMLRVGAAYVMIGDVEKALTLLTKVRDLRPNSAEANHYLGRAYLKQGGIEAPAAMRYLQRAVTLDPNKAEYHLYVAWAANEASPAQLGLARTSVDKALALDKLLADAYWQRGVLLRKEGQVVDAIKDLKHALELKPTRFEAHAALAEALEDKNDTPGAMAEWQKAISGNDKQPYWRWKYGKLLAVKGQNAEAAKHLVYAVTEGQKIQPRPGWVTQAAFEAGEAQRKSGQKKEACENYQLFMALSPSTSPDRRDALRAIAELSCPTSDR